MDLNEKQRAIQRESYVLLQERIEKISKKGQAKEFAEASGMLRYVQKLIIQIDGFKEKYFQEVLGKIIVQENDH